MNKRSFDEAVQIKLRDHPAIVRNARDAAQALLDVRWPKAGPCYQKALEICLGLLERKRGAACEAKKAFVDAAIEAGILTDKSAEGAI